MSESTAKVKPSARLLPAIMVGGRPLRLNRAIRIGGSVLLLMVVMTIFAKFISPYDPMRMTPADRLQPPLSAGHVLGTDHLGRDMMARLLYGARLSLTVGLGTVILVGIGGTVIGATAGYFSRWDAIVMRVMDAFMSFPAILLAIALMAMLGGSLANVIIALGVVYIPRMARVVRSSVLSVRHLDYVSAAIALGSGANRVMWRHILPNCMGPVLVQLTFIFANAVLAEASLSFLGVGLDPGTPSWGTMLNESRIHMRNAAWVTMMPGVAIMLTVLSLNLVGDGLRDALDPTMKNSR